MGHQPSTTYTFDEITTDRVSDCDFTVNNNVLSMTYAYEPPLSIYLYSLSQPKKSFYHFNILFTSKDNLKFELYTRTFLNKYDCCKLADVVFKIL